MSLLVTQETADGVDEWLMLSGCLVIGANHYNQHYNHYNLPEAEISPESE